MARTYGTSSLVKTESIFATEPEIFITTGRDEKTTEVNFSLHVFGLTWFRLAAAEQHGVHVHEEDHAAKVEVEVESLVERRRYVRGYYFRHGKGDPHHNQKFPVQRAQSGRQGVAAAEKRKLKLHGTRIRVARGLNSRSRK